MTKFGLALVAAAWLLCFFPFASSVLALAGSVNP
jgi:hypothetical protein